MTHAEAPPVHGQATRSWKDTLAPFVAALLVLAASFGNFLSYHDYPFLRAEVAMVAVWFVPMAAVFAAAHLWSSNFGRALLDGLLVFLAIDLNSDYTLVAVGVAGAAALLRLSRNVSLLEPLLIIALVVLGSSLAGLTERKPAIATVAGDRQQPVNDRPAILHLILDEHGGPGGASDPIFKRKLVDFYTGHGFRLFERAYSRHFHTVNAIPDVLNFGHPGESKNVSETLDIGRTTYLSALEKQGYRLNFYQSDFADFCRYHRFSTCTSAWSPSMSFLKDRQVTVAEKARLLALKFTALSSGAVATANLLDLATRIPVLRPLDLPVLAPTQRAVSNTLGGLATLKRMTSDLKSAQPGNVYFAHVLAPHYPYLTKADCSLIRPSDWGYRRSARSIASREAAYREQVACVTAHVDKLIRAFDASPAGKNGVIVIHGDHGSRITRIEPADWNREKIEASDLMAGYSTLFAVRAPGIEPGIDRTPYASPAILKRLAESRFSSLDGLKPGPGRVYLDGPNWTVGSPISIADAWPEPNLTVSQP
ncbi:MAG: hypothetical protein M3448_02415 [Pseudomonadota bacterium]|nr:hypothetical protein [Pseudomonadota bacterium]